MFLDKKMFQLKNRRQHKHERRPITVLFIIGRLGVGGKERQLVELINNLSSEHFNVHLLVKNNDNPYVAKIKSKLATFSSLEKKHFSVVDVYSLVKHIKLLEPDIISTWSNVVSHFCMVAGIFTSVPFKLLNCSIRNAPIKLSLRNRFERFMYSRYQHVVSNSYAGLEAYGQNGQDGRQVLYNGFDTRRVPEIDKNIARSKLTGVEDGTCLVVMVASLTSKKDHNTLLNAAKICCNSNQSFTFLIVGDGDRRIDLEEYVSKLGIEHGVTFLGRRDDVELILKACDISLLISTAHFGEGVSNTILESFACGVPMIATDSPGTREVIQDGENGIIIQPGDSDSLAQKIMALERNPKKRTTLVANGLNTIETKFSMDKCIRSFEKILSDLMVQR